VNNVTLALHNIPHEHELRNGIHNDTVLSSHCQEKSDIDKVDVLSCQLYHMSEKLIFIHVNLVWVMDIVEEASENEMSMSIVREHSQHERRASCPKLT
jgi:hypothetical protein